MFPPSRTATTRLAALGVVVLRSRAERLRWLALVGLLPTALLVVGVARFSLNHFYTRAPYLLDSGWLSWLIHRGGFVPINPPIACNYAETFYHLHISPFLSLVSMASYLVPLERIEWFAVFQAWVFLPFGAAIYLAVSRMGCSASPLRLGCTVGGALASCFSPAILTSIDYPHFEASIAGWTCVLLASVVTGRRWLALVSLILALSVREDAGLHVALAVLPLALVTTSFPDPSACRRTVLTIAASALAATGIAMVVQKVWFPGASLFRAEYLGSPPLAHVTARLVVERLSFLLLHRKALLAPAAAALLIAAARRDWRYALGYLGTLPWFVVNFLAHQPEKAHFDAYTGFPFIVGFYWVYLYGSLLAPEERRIGPVALSTFVVVVEVIAMVLMAAGPERPLYTLQNMAFGGEMKRREVHGLQRALREQQPAIGRLIVDDSVAAIALESVRLGQSYGLRNPGSIDAIAFHQENHRVTGLLPELSKLELTHCTHLVGTSYSICKKQPLPAEAFPGLEIEDIPPLLAIGDWDTSPLRHRRRGTIDRASEPGLFFITQIAPPASEYEIRWAIDVDGVLDREAVFLEIESRVNGIVRARSTVPASTHGLIQLQHFVHVTNGDILNAVVWLRSRGAARIVDAQLIAL